MGDATIDERLVALNRDKERLLEDLAKHTSSLIYDISQCDRESNIEQMADADFETIEWKARKLRVYRTRLREINASIKTLAR